MTSSKLPGVLLYGSTLALSILVNVNWDDKTLTQHHRLENAIWHAASDAGDLNREVRNSSQHQGLDLTSQSLDKTPKGHQVVEKTLVFSTACVSLVTAFINLRNASRK